MEKERASDTVSEKGSPEKPASPSRRGFLGKLGMGVAAFALVSTPAFPWIRGSQRRSTPAGGDGLPGEDSIFHPRDAQ